MESFDQLEKEIQKAELWLVEATKVFLKEGAQAGDLLEVLLDVSINRTFFLLLEKKIYTPNIGTIFRNLIL